MKVTEVTIKKAQFDTLSEDERVLLVLLGHLHNEIITLHKLLVFTRNSAKGATSDIERRIFFGQALFIARMYCGKLFEGWEMIKGKYFGSKLSIEFDRLMDKGGGNALAELKKYFNSKNLLSKIRDIAFHKPDADEIKNLLAEHQDDIHIVSSGLNANTYYTYFDILVNFSILSKIDESRDKAMRLLWDEMLAIGEHMIDFTGSCALAIMERSIDAAQVSLKDVSIGEPPDINEVILPFFVTNKGRL